VCHYLKEQRCVIRFLRTKGLGANAVHSEMCADKTSNTCLMWDVCLWSRKCW